MAFQQNKHIYKQEDAVETNKENPDHEKNLFEFLEKQKLRRKI